MKVRVYITLIISAYFFNFCEKTDNPVINEPSEIYFGGYIVDMIDYPIYNIPDVKVKITSNSYIDSTTTNNTGYFGFQKIHPNYYQVLITKNGYDTIQVDRYLASVDSINIVFELRKNTGFREGKVIVGFFDTVSVNILFPLIDSLGLIIEKLNGFVYKSSISIDSLDYVRRILSSKSYLVVTNYTVYNFSGTITSVCPFINLDKNKFNDWMTTQNDLRFVHVDYSYKNGDLDVPAGEEIKWARELRQYTIFRYIGLDYAVIVNPH